ncbi:trigger factor [Edaphobacter sp. 12200R-103]|jgi:trigger factor|uniref:trigger factor n=1 Tax=Edaphobacter sp. 12200R-103 TaxID=2703788 RepID=UPI00138D9E04|nr:trigger factor [Edaphobacter sp. 12200R-103]QHS50958.1 trigger factor [Edaphobacter sp. 12200R-103]
MELTPTETTETTNTPEEQQPETAHTHDHDHDHAHEHQHGPTLNPELTKEIAVEVPAEEVSKTFKTVTKRYQKLARIPGFRAGKVPESLVRSKFSKELRQEVLESLVSERFRKAIDEQNLRPISEPQLLDLQLNDGEPLTFKAAFEVAPVFGVEGYDTVKIERPDIALTDDEYQAELSRVLDSHATVEAVEEDRPLADGDWAEIQFKGEVKDLAQTVTEDGVESSAKSEPITGEDVLVEIGGKNTLPAFTEALRGAKPGQEMSFEVAYPAEFGEPRLAGQTVSYDVTVKTIKKKTFPERDADFAKQLGNYESWEDFETKLREMAADRKKNALESQARDRMLDELVHKFQFPVPESFVQQQIDARLDRGLRALAQQGMSPEEMRKLDFGRLRAAQRDQALNEVKASMLLDKIGEAEQVAISEEDLDRELLMLSLQSREPLEELRNRLTKDGSLDRIREQMRREKTASVLYEKLAS